MAQKSSAKIDSSRRQDRRGPPCL